MGRGTVLAILCKRVFLLPQVEFGKSKSSRNLSILMFLQSEQGNFISQNTRREIEGERENLYG